MRGTRAMRTMTRVLAVTNARCGATAPSARRPHPARGLRGAGDTNQRASVRAGGGRNEARDAHAHVAATIGPASGGGRG